MKRNRKRGKELHPGYFSMDQIPHDKRKKKKKNINICTRKRFCMFFNIIAYFLKSAISFCLDLPIHQQAKAK